MTDRTKLDLPIQRLYALLSKASLGSPPEPDSEEGKRPSLEARTSLALIHIAGIDPDALDPVSEQREALPLLSMSAEEKAVLGGLSGCEFKAGSADRQFCRRMWDEARRVDDFGMTEGQHAYLWRLAYRYRHQLSPEVNAIMEKRLERLRRARLEPEPLPP
jgi:hypothetical protein